MAMLVQAIRDIRSAENSRQAREWKADAVRWFASKAEGPGSFAWVCGILEWDPGKTRKALRALRIDQ
ncbi:MAG: hypothetical protein ACE15E_01140 [Acidobacteriota bacterium]